MDSQIFLNNNLIHPETNSDVVKHNNSNLKNFLNGLVSTDNMPAFMQSFLMSNNYIAANQALHTIPETFFDQAFNSWTSSSAPSLNANGTATFSGNQYLQADNQFSVSGADFSIELRIKPAANSSYNNFICGWSSAYGSDKVRYFLAINKDSNTVLLRAYSNTTTVAYDLNSSQSVTIGAWSHIELDYSYSASTVYLFLNGTLCGTISKSPSLYSKFRIGLHTNAASPGTSAQCFIGDFDYIRISDCVRHTSNFTPATPTFDDNTLSLLLFD